MPSLAIKDGFVVTPSSTPNAFASRICARLAVGEIEKTLETFFTRFRQQQFKRSCIPDGPKVGTVSLSPRGDLRMPSDMVELH